MGGVEGGEMSISDEIEKTIRHRLCNHTTAPNGTLEQIKHCVWRCTACGKLFRGAYLHSKETRLRLLQGW